MSFGDGIGSWSHPQIVALQLAWLHYATLVQLVSSVKDGWIKKTLRQEAALKTAARNGVFFCWSYFPLNKPSEIPKPGGGLRASRIIARSPCQGSTLLTTRQNLRFSPPGPRSPPRHNGFTTTEFNEGPRQKQELVSGILTPLKNMKVTWDYYSQYMGKSISCSKPTREHPKNSCHSESFPNHLPMLWGEVLCCCQPAWRL